MEYNAANQTFSRTSDKSRTIVCGPCSTANHLQATLSGYDPAPEFKDFQASLDDLKAQADSITSKINDFVASYPECQPRVNGYSALRDVQSQIRRYF